MAYQTCKVNVRSASEARPTIYANYDMCCRQPAIKELASIPMCEKHYNDKKYLYNEDKEKKW